MKFSKVIIWGHKLHSHSHSYIHDGFYKAFKHLGYDTYWLDEKDDVSNLDFNNSLFLSECQVEGAMPIVPTSKYISHNTGIAYMSFKGGETLYSTGKPLEINRNYEPSIVIDLLNYYSIRDAIKVNDYTYTKNKTLIQPWATNLLPHEFDFDMALKPRKQEAYFFGTVVNAGWNNNKEEIDEFKKACVKHNISFDYRGLYTKQYISDEEILGLIRQARAAPAIQCEEQIEAGYVGCRFFKNISYGHYCITNSVVAKNVFGPYIPNLICCKPQEMLNKLFELENEDQDKQVLIEQMKYIQNNHTYINRINAILERL